MKSTCLMVPITTSLGMWPIKIGLLKLVFMTRRNPICLTSTQNHCVNFNWQQKAMVIDSRLSTCANGSRKHWTLCRFGMHPLRMRMLTPLSLIFTPLLNVQWRCITAGALKTLGCGKSMGKTLCLYLLRFGRKMVF